MFCSNCGNQIPDNAKYCQHCGERVTSEKENNVRTIILRCKQCNGELSVDEKQKIMCCPYCGSKEMIIESDSVKTAQIHANAYRDVEFGKQQTAVKMKQMDIDERTRDEDNVNKARKKGFVLMLVSIALFIFSVEFQIIFSGGMQLFITVLCIMLFVAGWRLRKDNSRNKKRK